GLEAAILFVTTFFAGSATAAFLGAAFGGSGFFTAFTGFAAGAFFAGLEDDLGFGAAFLAAPDFFAGAAFLAGLEAVLAFAFLAIVVKDQLKVIECATCISIAVVVIIVITDFRSFFVHFHCRLV